MPLPTADALRAVLDAADQVIVPIEPEPLCFDASARTITKVIQPRNLPYTVVINNWDPRDGRHDLDETKEFVKGNRWPLAKTVVRHYKLHARASADGQVVTEYPRDEMTLPAQEDFYQLALELNRLDGEAATKKPATAWISSEVYSRLLEFSDQEKRTQLRAARPFGVIAMDAIENHADQLGSMWKRSEARSPASGRCTPSSSTTAAAASASARISNSASAGPKRAARWARCRTKTSSSRWGRRPYAARVAM